MESLNPKVALYGSHNECSRTDIVFLSLSEVGNVAVSLREWRRGMGVIAGVTMGLVRSKVTLFVATTNCKQ